MTLGLRVVNWFCPGLKSRPERVFFSFLAGLGVISLIELGTGFVGFFRTGCFAIILVFAVSCLGTALTEVRALIRESKPGKLPDWALFCLGAVLITQVGSLVSGFTPPHISDEQTYHLGTAKWYLELGKIAFWPSNVYIFYPQMDTMLYAPYISLGLLYGIKWLHWIAGLLGAWGLWLVLEKVPRPIRIGALMLYLTIPAIWIVAGRAFNDLLILAYATGALLAAERSRGSSGRPALMYALLAGACVGFAASNKYNGLLLGFLLLPFLSWKKLFAAGAVAAVVVSPWLIKNWIWLGNPLFPYFWRILGGLGWDEHLAWRYKKKLLQADITFTRKLVELPALLWNLPMKSLGSGTDSNTGPLMVLGFPLLLLNTGAFETLGLAALIGFFLPTVFGSIGVRYLIPALPLMIFLGARRLSSFGTPRRGRGLLAAGFTALLFYQASDIYQTAWKNYDDPLPLFFGRESLPKYLDRMLYPHLYYPYSYSLMLDAVQRLTPPKAKLLFLGAYGGTFYIPRRAIFAPMLGRPLPLIFSRESPSLPEIRKKFKQLGITHILVNRRHPDVFYDFWKVWDWGNGQDLLRWRDFWDQYAVLEWKFWDHFTLHSLSAIPIAQTHQATPGFEDESLRLVHTMISKKRHDYAGNLLKTIIRLFPGNPATWQRGTEYFISTDKIKEAQACCEEVRTLAPGSNESKRCLALLLVKEGKIDEAVRLLEQVAVREAFDPQIWADLFVLYGAQNNQERAAFAWVQYTKVREFRLYR